MPRLSERARLIQSLSRCLRLSLSAAALDEEFQADVEEAEEALGLVDSNRYLSRDRLPNDMRARRTRARCVQHLSWNEDDFKRGFRVTKAQFKYVVSLLETDEVFARKARGRPQHPVQYQVLLVLWRLAHSATGATAFQIAERFGVSEGTVISWTDRVLCALIGIEDRYVWWPSLGERQQLRQQLSDHHGLAGCIGFIDGTHINFAGAPARKDAADFFTRHHRYSFNVLAVVDIDRRFRFLHLGFPGSAHDQRVYRACALFQAPDQHFSANEFILGDSGYTSDAHLVSLFRRYRGQETLAPSQVAFNQHASPRRVTVEHAFGILKLRWQSLRALPISLRDELEESRAACWIRACVVLHNLLVDDAAEPGQWLTAEERELAQREHGPDFTRWEHDGDAALHAVGADVGQSAPQEEQVGRTEGQILRQKVQEFARVWRQQR
ncbi:hypothetical protein CF336_g8389 [Tilletia laevis]|nr:hypothetical protein CF336_g8389 [Tilletia laevis]